MESEIVEIGVVLIKLTKLKCIDTMKIVPVAGFALLSTGTGRTVYVIAFKFMLLLPMVPTSASASELPLYSIKR